MSLTDAARQGIVRHQMLTVIDQIQAGRSQQESFDISIRVLVPGMTPRSGEPRRRLPDCPVWRWCRHVADAEINREAAGVRSAERDSRRAEQSWSRHERVRYNVQRVQSDGASNLRGNEGFIYVTRDAETILDEAVGE